MKMNRIEEISKYRKLFTTSEYRGLNQAEKALLLIKNEKINKQLAADICQIDRHSVVRACESQRAGREISHRGNVCYFTDEQNHELVERLKELRKTERLSYEVVRQKVIFFY